MDIKTETVQAPPVASSPWSKISQPAPVTSLDWNNVWTVGQGFAWKVNSIDVCVCNTVGAPITGQFKKNC
jgi:hypothetical protein